MKAKDLLENGEKALLIRTNGSDFEVNDDGTGSSGYWNISPKRQYNKVIIYTQKNPHLPNEVYIADHVKLIQHSHGLRSVSLANIRSLGSIPENWYEFAHTTLGARKSFRYVEADKIVKPNETPNTDITEIEKQISIGAGFGDPETNREVEKAAISHVTKCYENQGWNVQSVEAKKCGYDLLCTKGSLEEHVEVKGIKGTGLSFIITAGEVRQAKINPNFVLCAVTSALLDQRQMVRYTQKEFNERFKLEELAFRASIIK